MKEEEVTENVQENTPLKEEQVDIIKETAEKHAVLEELLRKVFQENEEILTKKVKEDAVVEIKGFDFVNILNVFLTLKEHNSILRSMVLQLEHLLKVDDIETMIATKNLTDTFLSLDIEDKLEEYSEEEKD